MGWLVFINVVIIAVAVGVLLLCKKYFTSEKQIRILFLVLPLLTVACHYSSLIYHAFAGISSMEFLISNPNLILPIYPCNVIMWLLVILGVFWKYRDTKVFKIIIDFCFYFGIASALVGMFANVDFILNPTLKDYDITKSIVAHGFMLMNIMALGFYKIVKTDLHSNFVHLVIGVAFMGILGAYNNLVIYVFAGDYANDVNSMFLLHSPFDGVPFLVFPVIALICLPIYFGIFQIIDLFAYEKGNRWIHREKHW